uniref:Chromo domain-containing protein n=1 Tax=Ananas comosus var. bracteatus TaxID=296719 RepID=A0A6V7QHH0_ANACO|nr:unnamed protein product [Ananas comosus var. bracteatus]
MISYLSIGLTCCLPPLDLVVELFPWVAVPTGNHRVGSHPTLFWGVTGSHVSGAAARGKGLREDLSFEEQPVRILAREVRKLRNQDIPYVKVLWSNHDEREATWELESALQERYPHLFQMES